MATFDDIKATILDIAGNPSSGVIAEYADKWATAIVALDQPLERDQATDGTLLQRPAKKETRVTKPTETR
jgi:hypothetical protein